MTVTEGIIMGDMKISAEEIKGMIERIDMEMVISAGVVGNVQNLIELIKSIKLPQELEPAKSEYLMASELFVEKAGHWLAESAKIHDSTGTH